MSHRFFTNKDCKYYPCHTHEDGSPMEDINCLFCYCPLYLLDCPGNYTFTSMGIKDCTECTLPHHKAAYDTILDIFANKFLMSQTPECEDPKCATNDRESSYMCDICISNLINSISSDDLYELYAVSSEFLKDNPEAVNEFIKRLPDGEIKDKLNDSNEEDKTESVNKFWFESVNSILLDRDNA